MKDTESINYSEAKKDRAPKVYVVQEIEAQEKAVLNLIL